MSIISWNARGLGNKPTMRRLKRLFKSKHLCFAAIFEPKIDNDKIKQCMLSLKCVGCAFNSEGNIWLMWTSDISCSILHSTAQYITVKVHTSDLEVIFTCVHASSDPSIRLNARNDLININYNDPW